MIVMDVCMERKSPLVRYERLEWKKKRVKWENGRDECECVDCGSGNYITRKRDTQKGGRSNVRCYIYIRMDGDGCSCVCVNLSTNFNGTKWGCTHPTASESIHMNHRKHNNNAKYLLSVTRYLAGRLVGKYYWSYSRRHYLPIWIPISSSPLNIVNCRSLDRYSNVQLACCGGAKEWNLNEVLVHPRTVYKVVPYIYGRAVIWHHDETKATATNIIGFLLGNETKGQSGNYGTEANEDCGILHGVLPKTSRGCTAATRERHRRRNSDQTRFFSNAIEYEKWYEE